MESGDEASSEEAKVRQDYEAVCSQLNMDQASMDSAWTSYVGIRDYYVLEVRNAVCTLSLQWIH